MATVALYERDRLTQFTMELNRRYPKYFFSKIIFLQLVSKGNHGQHVTINFALCDILSIQNREI